MTEATFIAGDPKPTIRLERFLADSPSLVWKSLTERDELRSWFPCDVEVEGGRWVVGATITFTFPPAVIDVTLSGEVLIVDEPHALSYTWGDERLSFELHAQGSGTLLVLLNELERDAAARNAAGWDDCLDRLLGVAPVDGSWRPRFERYSAAFEGELGAQSGPPAEYKGTDSL